eukprot:m.59594 g.59594  ORF g.59594 m.59594 type:complete len:76 (-) comp7913_c0_seq1:119-346(-)
MQRNAMSCRWYRGQGGRGSFDLLFCKVSCGYADGVVGGSLYIQMISNSGDVRGGGGGRVFTVNLHSCNVFDFNLG